MASEVRKPCCGARADFHPTQCSCRFLMQQGKPPLPLCVSGSVIVGDGGPGPQDIPTGPVVIKDGGPGPHEIPVPESLQVLIAAIDAAGPNASPRLLANLADELADAGCAEQALRVSQAARDIAQSTDFNILSRTYQIDAEAHRLLGNDELTRKSHDLATHLTSAARLRLDMGDLQIRHLDNALRSR